MTVIFGILFASVGICAIIELAYCCRLTDRTQQRNDKILKLTKETKNIIKEMEQQPNEAVMIIPLMIELLYHKGVVTEQEYKHIVDNMQADNTFEAMAKAIGEVCNDD